MQGVLIKTITFEGLLFSMVLALSPSYPHPTSLSRIDSILRWVLPTRGQITTNRDRRSPLRTSDGRWRCPLLVMPPEGPGGVLIGPGMNQSLQSGPCNALIGQLGTQAQPQGQELPSWFETVKGWIHEAVSLLLPNQWNDTGQRTNICSLSHLTAEFGESISH